MTKNSINSNIPIEIPKGGTADTSFLPYSVICGGTSSTGPLQTVMGTGNLNQVLTSLGAGMLPIWEQLPTFFTPLASDPTSPNPGDTWYNTTTNLFKGAIASGAGGLWVIKANMNVPRNTPSQGGIPGDTLGSQGFNGSGFLTTSEVYAGVANTWSIVAGALYQCAFGRGTGATSGNTLVFSGQPPAGGFGVKNCNLYNGVANTWSAKANLVFGYFAPCAAGDASSALCIGGEGPGTPGEKTAVQKYDGVGNIWNLVAPTLQPSGYTAGAGTYTFSFECVVALEFLWPE